MVIAWLRRRLPTTRSLRSRLRLSLFVASAGIALLLGGGAIVIDETLERAVLQNTLQAEANKFAGAATQSDTVMGTSELLMRYYADGEVNDDVDLDLDHDATLNPQKLETGLLCNAVHHCGLPAWVKTFRHPHDQTAWNPPLRQSRLNSATFPAPTQNFTRHLTRSLSGFYQSNAQKRTNVPVAFQDLGPGFHEDVALNGRTYYLLVQKRADGLVYIAYDTTRLRQRLRWFTALTLAAMLILILLADQVGKRLASYLSRPLESLAAQVRSINPGARDQHMDENHGDPALDGIARAFNEYLSQMDAYVRREQAFTRTASHELRTPLTVIGGAIEVMRLQRGHVEHESAPMERIERALRQMRETTDALLMLARNRRHDGEESRCRVDRILTDIVASHRLLVGKKAVELVVDSAEPCEVDAAERLVAILIANLVRNAVEHTEQGCILVSTDANGLSVSDTGAGMDPKRAADLLATEPGDCDGFGFGLGLYIVGQICRRYGWTPRFSNNVRGGTTVRIAFDQTS